MSRRIGNTALICPEAPDECQECGKFDELRPYGEGGKRICFDCAQKDPEGTEKRMDAILFDEKPPN